MNNQQGDANAPEVEGIKSWWNAFMIGAVTGGALAATAAIVTVMGQ